MDQWKKLLASLSSKQRVAIAGAAIVVVASLMFFGRWRHDRDFKPLFTGVAPDDASLVVQKLKESGVEYRISDDGGSTILVPSSRLPELRLQMAGSGLPKSGRIGFELFDRTNLGTTDFAEHINYARALEGELERSIRSITEVEQARVHITFPKDSIFAESRLPAKASVLLRVRSGGKVAPQNVVAICHLVASAVEGLAPESVSVLDMRGNLLSRARRGSPGEDNSEQSLEYRQKLERDMLTKIQTTLEPLLGPERFRASVAIECDLTSGEESQETYDPERTVMLTTQKTEEGSNTTTASASGVPGTPSNMPRPTSRPANGPAGASRRTESVSYQPSKTVRHVRTPQGVVKKVSVALLIDHTVRWESKDKKPVRTLVPPSPEMLKTIRDVTSATVGLNVERGDQVVVESLPFESTLSAEPPPGMEPQSVPAQPQNPLGVNIGDPRTLLIGGAAAVLLLAVIGSGVFRVLRRKQRRAAVAMASEVGSGSDPKRIADGHADDMRQQLTDHADEKRQMIAEAQQKLKLQPVQTQKSEVLVGYLREAVKNDPQAAASVIRTWLHED